MNDAATTPYNVILAGGGLQNCLIALALLSRRPGCRFLLIERDSKLAGNHTWSFHADDLPETAREFVAPLITWQWPSYDVRFPNLERTLPDAYATISAERVDQVVREGMRSAGQTVWLETAIREVGADAVTLEDGRVARGELIVDARGPDHLSRPKATAFQKFVGLDVTFTEPVAPVRPVVMDACVDQTCGFRFLYILPFAPNRALVEDTYFNTDPDLDVDAVRDEVRRYIAGRGWTIARIEREEHGVLPLPWRLEPASSGTRPLRAGFGGGWFHPTTGYSFPLAVRIAELVASREGKDLERGLERLASEHAAQSRFGSLLNWLLFRCQAPTDRLFTLERFYRLPAGTIRRFYSMRLTWPDRGRILCGRPPRGFNPIRPFRVRETAR